MLWATRHTETEQTRADEGEEKEGEADVELRFLADGGRERLACRSLPEIVEGRCRHGGVFQ